MSKAFINYRTSDESFAAVHLDACLCERLGPENVFRDSRAIPAGKDFERRLWAELGSCSLLIVVIGPRWDTDRLHDPADFVRREIAFALDRDIDVMPVLVGGVPLPRAEDLPEDIRPLTRRQYRRIHARSAEPDMAAVLQAVEQSLNLSVDTRQPAVPSAPRGVNVHGDWVGGDKVMGDKFTGNKNVWR